MTAVASKYNIELTFFHGKGGTVGRGGNPALYRAILSHPPNTINGRFRVTEQVSATDTFEKRYRNETKHVLNSKHAI